MAKIIKPLSDVEIKKAKAKEKDYYLFDGEGLCLLIKKNGSKLWRCNFTFNSKRNTVSFGSYPEISLKEAREKKDELKLKVSKGINPAVSKNDEDDQTMTFQIIADKWLHLMKDDWSTSNYEKIKGNLVKNAYPFIGNKAMGEITKKDIFTIIERMEHRNAVEYSNRLLNNIERIYRYAIAKEYINHNVIADIDKKNSLKKRKKGSIPAITDKKELKELHNIIKHYNDDFKTDVIISHALKLAPYLALRPYNLRFLEWEEIDFENKYISIPAEKMKMSVDFVMPLSKQALKIIKDVEVFRTSSKYVFYSPNTSLRCISENTLNHALHRLGYKGKHTAHGFRSSFSTNAHENVSLHGKNSDIIESCLAHAELNTVKKAYNRESKFKYLDEKRELMQWWADWLDDL